MAQVDAGLADWIRHHRYLRPADPSVGESGMALLLLWEVDHQQPFPTGGRSTTTDILVSFNRRLKRRIQADPQLAGWLRSADMHQPLAPGMYPSHHLRWGVTISAPGPDDPVRGGTKTSSPGGGHSPPSKPWGSTSQPAAQPPPPHPSRAPAQQPTGNDLGCLPRPARSQHQPQRRPHHPAAATNVCLNLRPSSPLPPNGAKDISVNGLPRLPRMPLQTARPAYPGSLKLFS